MAISYKWKNTMFYFAKVRKELLLIFSTHFQSFKIKLKPAFLINLCHVFRVVSVNPYSLLEEKKGLGKRIKKSYMFFSFSSFFLIFFYFFSAEHSQVSVGGRAEAEGPQLPSHMHPTASLF